MDRFSIIFKKFERLSPTIEYISMSIETDIVVFTIGDQFLECVFPRSNDENNCKEEWMDTIEEYLEGVTTCRSTLTKYKVKTYINFKKHLSKSETLTDLLNVINQFNYSLSGLVSDKDNIVMVCVKQMMDISNVFNQFKEQVEDFTDEEIVIKNSKL